MTRLTKQFILAGNATFTVETPANGHRTYKVEYAEAKNGFPEAYFVKLLTGPDNESDYTYLGKLDTHTAEVKTTAKSKSLDGSYSHKLINRVLPRLWCGDHGAYEQHGFKVHHEGCCGRCGRKLTTPESCESGFGPECRNILGIETPKSLRTKETTGKPVEVKDVNYYTPRKGEEKNSFFASDSDCPPTFGMNANYNADNELTHWTSLDGKVTVWND